MTKLDFFGHWAYFFIFMGMMLLSERDHRGWVFRFAGEIGWICIGMLMGMTSIVAWGFAFLVVDGLGYLKWREEDRLSELGFPSELSDDFWPDVEGPDCEPGNHLPECREFKPVDLDDEGYWMAAGDPVVEKKVKKNVKSSIRKTNKPQRPKRRRVPSVRKVRSNKVSKRKVHVPKKKVR